MTPRTFAVTGRPVLSFSSTKDYMNCPAMFCRKQLERERPPTDRDITATVGGNIIDRQARKFFRNYRDTGIAEFRFLNPEDPSFQGTFTEFADAPGVTFQKGAWASSRDDAWNKIAVMADKFATTIQDEGLTTGNELILSEDEAGSTSIGTWKEPLAINDRLKVSGAFDFFCAVRVKRPGRLIDFKAARRVDFLDPLQLNVYELGITRKWGHPIGLSGFLLFNQKKIHWHGFKTQNLKTTEDSLTAVSDSIMKGVFPYTPSKKACGFCPYRTACENVYVEPTVVKEKLKLVVDSEPEL